MHGIAWRTCWCTLASQARWAAVDRPALRTPVAHAWGCTLHCSCSRPPLRRQRAGALLSIQDPVISTQWLADHLDDVSILDVRGHVDTVTVSPGVEQSTYLADYDKYLEGHIPGAVFLDWRRDGIDLQAPAPVQLQEDEGLFAAALEAKGVSTEQPVVCYDEGDGMLAARLWWALMVHGHPQPLLLEGGWQRWQQEGRPSQLYEPCTLKVYANFEPVTTRPELRITAKELLHELQASSGDGIGSGSPVVAGGDARELLVLDTRSAAQHAKLVRRGPQPGRIPGSVSLPRGMLLAASGGAFKPLEEQAAVLQAVGVRLGPAGGGGQRQQQKVVLYCNGGVAACTAALALHRLGHTDWAVYDGSWNEWGAREDLPIE